MGWKTNSCCEVAFVNVRIPRENLIGAEGRGFNNVIASINEIRVIVGASAVGIAQGRLKEP